MNRLVDVVVRRIGIDVGDRFSANARKVKFVINGLPEDSDFPVKFTDFQVQFQVNVLGIMAIFTVLAIFLLPMQIFSD